jgi:hypothetical protein
MGIGMFIALPVLLVVLIRGLTPEPALAALTLLATVAAGRLTYRYMGTRTA